MTMGRRAVRLLLGGGLLLSGCESRGLPTALDALPEPAGGTVAAARINGPVGSTDASPAAQVSIGRGRPVALPGRGPAEAGDISLTSSTRMCGRSSAQVLGTILRVNYTIDPAVRGTATLRTVNPISRSQRAGGAAAAAGAERRHLIPDGGLYRVVPAGRGGSRTRGRGRGRGQRGRAAALRLGRGPGAGAAALCRRHRHGSAPTRAATRC